MTDIREVTCQPQFTRTLWSFVGLGAAGACLAAVRLAYRGQLLDVWLGVGLLLALSGIFALRGVTARMSADTYGVHFRRLPRNRSMPWRDITDLRIHLKYEHNDRVETQRRVGVALRGRRTVLLPLLRSQSNDDSDPEFDARVEALRALHARYGNPVSPHLPVISQRTAGGTRLGSLALCVLLLAGAGAAAAFIPFNASNEREWRSAVPCTAGTPDQERGECLTSMRAVIAKAEVNPPKKSSWLYFADGEPLERLRVSDEGAHGFEAGDSVKLTLWKREVREVIGEHHTWREHMTPPGDTAVIAALLALAAGYPGARVLIRLRGRRLPPDEVTPTALPFVGALIGTALWLLPLCYLHPLNPLATPQTVSWTIAGSLASLGLFALAWWATRVRAPRAAGEAPGEAGATGDSGDGRWTERADESGEVFVAARFLEHTDYNPYRFGTHIVIGDGPPAVTVHSGPDRFAAKPIPVERLTVKGVRRVRGGDGGGVPARWHVADLDDAGRPVRLAAKPADLARVLRALNHPAAPTPDTPPAPADAGP